MFARGGALNPDDNASLYDDMRAVADEEIARVKRWSRIEQVGDRANKREYARKRGIMQQNWVIESGR